MSTSDAQPHTGVVGLEVRDLDVVYHRRHSPPVRAVAGASLTVQPGHIVGLVGESGCGKSTLARAAAGLIVPASGEVLLHGERVIPLGHRRRDAKQAKLQMVFQDPYTSLNPRRTVGSQLRDALDTLNLVPKNKRDERVAELIETVGLPAKWAQRYPHQFSGGQRQRLAIARALSAEPSVMVLDEPLSALDASAQAQIGNLLQALCRELQIGMLLISHDLAIVNQIADTVAVMYLGKIIESGPTGAVWSDPRHPYTEALVGAIPPADGLGTLPIALPGEVPNPASPPSGCRFHPRCPLAFDPCSEAEPPRISTEPGRTQACWLHDPSLKAGKEVASGVVDDVH